LFDRRWASIHSAPPWRDTAAPAVVIHEFGRGQAVYSAADIETIPSPVNEAVLIGLVRRLLDGPATVEVDAHPAVWTAAMHQAEHRRYTLGLLNYQSDLPALPLERVGIALRPPSGRRFTQLLLLPEKSPVPFTTEADGTLHAEVPGLRVFAMLMAPYA